MSSVLPTPRSRVNGGSSSSTSLDTFLSRARRGFSAHWGFCHVCAPPPGVKGTSDGTSMVLSGPSRVPIPYCGCCGRSEEHTSELQSQSNLVCRLLLEKKKKKKEKIHNSHRSGYR